MATQRRGTVSYPGSSPGWASNKVGAANANLLDGQIYRSGYGTAHGIGHYSIRGPPRGFNSEINTSVVGHGDQFEKQTVW